MAGWHVSAGPSARLALGLRMALNAISRTTHWHQSWSPLPAVEPQTIDHSTGEAVSYFDAVLLEKTGTLTPSIQAGGDQGRARWSIRVGKSCSLRRCTGVLQGLQGFAAGAPNHRWDSELQLETFGIQPGTRGVLRRKRLLVIIISTLCYLQASNAWEQSTVAE